MFVSPNQPSSAGPCLACRRWENAFCMRHRVRASRSPAPRCRRCRGASHRYGANHLGSGLSIRLTDITRDELSSHRATDTSSALDGDCFTGPSSSVTPSWFRLPAPLALALAGEGVQTSRQAVSGSGLLTGWVDWQKMLPGLLRVDHPNAAATIFAGDYLGTPLHNSDGTSVADCSPGFLLLWEQAAAHLSEMVQATGATMYWVSPPPSALRSWITLSSSSWVTARSQASRS